MAIDQTDAMDTAKVAGAGGAGGSGSASNLTGAGGAGSTGGSADTARMGSAAGAPGAAGSAGAPNKQRRSRAWRITFNSPLVLVFAALCVVATTLGAITNNESTQLLFSTYHSSLANPLTYVRAFAHVFGHSGWGHLVGNMAYVLLLGPLLEEKYGWRTLLAVILCTALACSVVNYVLFPNQALLGASGVVFAFILLGSVTSAEQGEIPLTFLLVAAIFLGQQVYEGVFVADNVSQLSHIIGGVVGAAAGFLLARPKQ